FNVTRNAGGGTLQQGDTIEVHALAKINATVNNFYYVDTIPSGTQYVNNSLKIVTNEGVLYGGPYTNATNDDPGVYDGTGNARVRVNIGTGTSAALSGAGFGNTTGGGTVTAGSVPKFYGSTLMIVAYKLVISANNGDTIRPTGNFYLDTSGIKRRYRFDYGAIKIIANQDLCTNFSSASFTAESSFGSGTIQNRALPAIAPGYIKVNLGANAPQDNYYSIANNTSATGATDNTTPFKPVTNGTRVFGGFWDIVGDHTGAANQLFGNPPVAPGQPGGYMLVVNAAFTTGEVYRDTIKNVCPNTYYEFSAWLRNICKVCGIDKNSTATYTPGVYPNLSYTINDVDYYTTGNILHDSLWQKRGFIYKTGPTETQFRITVKNNAAGGGGNDWVLDDIKLATCYPDLKNSPKDTATACSGYQLTLSDTVTSYFNNYTYFCWEKSLDGINWTSTGVCGIKVPVLSNGLWKYVVDTSFTTVAADSATYYRLKVGTTFTNLNDPNCSVNNSQKIYLKVYNVSCSVLDTKLLAFTGKKTSENATLNWTIQNGEDVKYYVVEKSSDGVNFVQKGSILNKDLSKKSFTFTDPQKLSSVTFYRLRLVMKSNSADKYSNVIALEDKDDIQMKITTVNPFKSVVKMDIFIPDGGEIDCTLLDAFGKTVSKKKVMLNKGNSVLVMDDVYHLPTGMYILRVQYDNKILQNKLFKLN
ncbi:MAG: hypothetical protein ABIO82_03765, partial [Ginsengibacter sp.]